MQVLLNLDCDLSTANWRQIHDLISTIAKLIIESKLYLKNAIYSNSLAKIEPSFNHDKRQS